MHTARVTSHPINSRLIRINVTRRGAWLIHCIINVHRHVHSHLITYTAFSARFSPHSSTNQPFCFFSDGFQSSFLPWPGHQFQPRVRESRPSRALHLFATATQICHERRCPFVSRIFTGIRNGSTFGKGSPFGEIGEISRERNHSFRSIEFY